MVFRNTIPIQNLKCDNCATELKRQLLQIPNITNVFIDMDYSQVTFNHTCVNDLSNIENLLTFLGFPVNGEKTKKKNTIGCYCKDQSKNYCILKTPDSSFQDNA
ncbi:heavy-metal-associated domain-containing protein [Aquimarina sediminis]|uniref:heavy-metal-associated domain-containing protein n=1 Tax=Aquimarina sediminis TaxID=2070536 RepID=UPI000CA05354|nr:heavy-metal-associated domain-containing protein [Aquimarina sediminis]